MIDREVFGGVMGKVLEFFNRLRQLATGAPRQTALLSMAAFAALGPVIFMGFNISAQLLHPKDNPIAVTVSFLVFGSYGWLQTSAFYILGISLLALAAAIFLKTHKKKLNLGAIVVFLTGVAFLLVASNHVQNVGTVITTSEIVHRDAAIAIVVMSPLACFFMAANLKKRGHKGLWIYSICAGGVALLTIAVGFLIPIAHSNFLGIFERILLLNGQVWGEIICLNLIWTTFRIKRIAVHGFPTKLTLLRS